MRRSIVFFILFILAGVNCCLRAEEVSLTLDEAVSLALRNNRDVLLKTEDVKTAKENIQAAKSGLFPSASFTGGMSDTRGLYSKDVTQSSTQLSLKQYLYQSGKTANTIKQSKDKLLVSEALLDKERLEITLKVRKAFFTLLLSQGLAELNKSIMSNSQKHIMALEEQYANGHQSESELLRIISTSASTKQAYEASLNQVESGSALIKNLLFLDKEAQVNLKGGFSYLPVEVAYDEAFLKAMKSRPEIRQYEAQERADQKSIEIAKAGNRPSIYTSWDYYSRSNLTASTSKNWNDYNVIGLTFSWPVFDGWATKAKVEGALIDLKTTQLKKEKTLSDIALELKDAYIGLKDAIEKIKADRKS
ncbi:TolC family protein, partial [bacterium]